jgi:hypothetical protein
MKRTLQKIPGYRNPYIFITALLCCSFISIIPLRAQVLEPSIGLGLTSYIGDLPSYEFSDGFNILFGATVNGSLKQYISPKMNVRADLLFTMLRGIDSIAASESIKRRNLSFRSPVLQADLKGEWNVLGFIPGDPTYKLSPFVSGGIGVIRFNPQALYQGNWLSLQPLGTEGQGIPAFPDKEFYNRLQIVFPMGGGVKVNLSNQLTLTIEGIFHLTFTDYLDDVGGTSVTYPVLLEERGPITAALANRTGEFLGTDPVIIPSGQRRGNPDSNDYYFSGLISIGYALYRDSSFKPRGKSLKCPKF